MTNEVPPVLGSPTSHETLRKILASRTPCKVLDAATGHGALAHYLKNLGWDVHCLDIMPELLMVEGVPIHKVNLNRRLPFADESFDAIVCANAIHRLFNPAGAVREFHRILRQGGRLYLNFNNYACIETRVRFLLYGSLDIRPWEEGLDPLKDPEANVRVRLMYPQLAQYLDAAGFRIQRVLPTPPRLRYRWLLPLAGLISLLTKLIPEEKRRLNFMTVTNSRAILCGYYAVLEAEKEK